MTEPSPLCCPKCESTKLVRNGKTTSLKQRYGCMACGFRTTDPTSRRNSPKFSAIVSRDVKRYVITSAQNATQAHKPFLASLQAYCRERNAQLVIVPVRYRNPTRPTENITDDDWYAAELAPYLTKGRIDLHKKLVLLGDINVQPTASRPLSGLDSVTGAKSGLLPHPKYEMSVIATPHHRMPKIMMTTGSCTVENYSDSKAGAKGVFHHVMGAVIVEIDGPLFHMRHINAGKNGKFIDIDKAYAPDGSYDAPRAEALIVGDIHAGFEDRGTTEALFGTGGIAERLNPRNIVVHDVFDGFSVNPHEQGNPFILIGKSKYGLSGVENELAKAAYYIDSNMPGDAKIIWPSSNHHDFLVRWLQACNWKEDPENAEFYLSTALSTVRSLKHTARGVEWDDPFIEWMRCNLSAKDRCIFLSPHDSHSIMDIEVGQHGHLGPNGSRGTLANMSRLGTKAIIGHVHTPGVRDGAYAVGTCMLDAAYAKGPSSWLSAHCQIDAFGKRQMFVVVDGKWCVD